MHPTPSQLLACLSDFITVYLQVSAICRTLCLSSDIGIMLHKCKLAEILRQELNESDDDRNDSFSVDNDSSECEDVVEVNDDVPDELDEAGVDIGYCDSDDTVDYDVAVAAAAAAAGADDDVVNGDVAASRASTGDDDGDCDDVMWSRCGSIAWKRRCPAPAFSL